MKTIEIVGENYSGKWDRTRTACRSVVVTGGRVLMSYETKNDTWMLPGGGLEQNEDEKACVIRETSEETGLAVSPSECLLEIDEYYENTRYVSRYFFGDVTGKTERNPTKREKEAGMEPRWISVEEILEIFSGHAEYRDSDEMKRGLYLREYTALSELLGQNAE